jgi:hypothetical protein
MARVSGHFGEMTGPSFLPGPIVAAEDIVGVPEAAG